MTKKKERKNDKGKEKREKKKREATITFLSKREMPECPSFLLCSLRKLFH